MNAVITLTGFNRELKNSSGGNHMSHCPKTIITIVFACVLWLGLNVNAVAGSSAPADRELTRPSKAASFINKSPTRKLGRGISNVLFGILEIPRTMISINHEYGGAAGLTWGFLLGGKRFIIREVVGVYEILTFPWRQGTIIEPEFPFMPEERVEWRVQDPRHVSRR
jgi:putative exosortase-associated protein (TIGR04073 family)